MVAPGSRRAGDWAILLTLSLGFFMTLLALLMPQTMAIIIAIFPRERRGAALGVWGGVAALATIAGPTVGGLLVTWKGWRWIFFVNIPLGIVAMILATAIIPEVRSGKRLPLDLPGVLIASAGLVAVTYGLVEGQSCDWGPVWSFVSIPLILVTGVALLVIFVLVQALRQERRPLLPFTLFRDRNYALMATVSVIISIGLVGMALPLTLYLQTVLGFSALKAGLTMAPASLASGFSAPFVGKLADRGGKYLLITGFTLYATGLVSICLVAGTASHWYDLVPGYVITGLGVGFTMSPMQTIATRNVDPAQAGAASGVLNTTRQTGSALGSAVVLAVLQNRLAAHAAFVTAMRFALAVPISVLLLAALLCVAIRQRTTPTPAPTPAPRPAATSRSPAPAATSPALAVALVPRPRPVTVLAAPTLAGPARPRPETPAAAFLPARRRLEVTQMTEPADRWRRWLVDARASGDPAREQLLTTYLYPQRDDLLNRAVIQPGETVLDVGTGSGLIGFGALDRVGPSGTVIFSDVSADLLGRCRAAVAAEGLLDQSDFLLASADDLIGRGNASVDVVTARSVLAYVADRGAALREFHRVLRPGGRAVLVEPITRLQAGSDSYLGYDLRPVATLAAKLTSWYAGLAPEVDHPLLGFDDRDLLELAEEAGFGQISLELRVDVRASRPPCPWDRFLRMAPNPQLPPLGTVLDEALDAPEASQLTDYLRPLVESGTGRRRQSLAGLAAVKG
jgi:EmrB/QacA subfamily drug resistance transporter